MHVVVLGAGVVGVTTAYYLTERGHSVTVVDRADSVAAGASAANGGQLSYSFTSLRGRSIADHLEFRGSTITVVYCIARRDQRSLHIFPKVGATLVPYLVKYLANDMGIRDQVRTTTANEQSNVVTDLRTQCLVASDAMQIDVMRHLAIGHIAQVQLHHIALAHTDDIARHVPAECPEGVVDTFGNRHDLGRCRS